MNKITLIVLFAFLSLISCRIGSSGQYTYQQPTLIEDGFEVGNLVDIGADTTVIYNGINKILKGNFGEIHSILIYKNGKLVLEEYFKGHRYKWDGPRHKGEYVQWNENTLHHVQSVTKSITSICTGLVIDHGYIIDVNQSIFDFLPDYQYLNKGEKDKITIEHLLTMTPGIGGHEWNAPYSSQENPIVALWFPPCNDDPVRCILDKPVQSKAGSSYAYFGGNQILLGEIIRNATNMKIDEFSRKYLFEPLGIDTAEWASKFENGVIEAAGGLKLSPRAMTKIGVTYLNNGIWDGTRIISEHWVRKSATTYPGNIGIKVPGSSVGKQGYSYSWWTLTHDFADKTLNIYSASGWGGQRIYVISELDAVVVFTAGNFTSKPKSDKFLIKYVIPSLVSMN